MVSNVRKSAASTPSLKAAFEDVMCRYPPNRTSAFGRGTPAWGALTGLTAAIGARLPSAARQRVLIRLSAGQGRWASVPCVALLDTRETRRPSQGIFVAVLFQANMSGIYLTLNQGVAEMMGTTGAFRVLRSRAKGILERFGGDLSAAGFKADPAIDLKSDAALAEGYENGCVAFKHYSRGHIPNEHVLEADISGLMGIYSRMVPSRRTFAWWD